MINISFWKRIKEKWIKDRDPAEEKLQGIIQTNEDLEKTERRNKELNGDEDSRGGDASLGSITDIDRMIGDLDRLVPQDDAFDSMFKKMSNIE